MRTITPSDFDRYVRQLRLGGNLKRRLSAASLSAQDDNQADREMLAVPTKDGNAGVLLIALDERIYGMPYEINDIRDAVTGRSKPIICDFCKTWQAGPRAGYIVFRTKRASSNVIGFLCCADLQCSLHVRDKTTAAKTSRSQLREDVTVDQRVARLQSKLAAVIERLDLQPLE